MTQNDDETPAEPARSPGQAGIDAARRMFGDRAGTNPAYASRAAADGSSWQSQLRQRGWLPEQLPDPADHHTLTAEGAEYVRAARGGTSR